MILKSGTMPQMLASSAYHGKAGVRSEDNKVRLWCQEKLFQKNLPVIYFLP
jgi:hypothetical protein